MNSLKGSIVLACTIGIYAASAVVYAAPVPAQNQPHHSDSKNSRLTYSLPLFFNRTVEKNNVGPEVLLIENPAKRNTGKYVTLTEHTANINPANSQKKISVKQSFAVKSSPILAIGTIGLSPLSSSDFSGGFSGYGTTVAGNNITFSYANDGLLPDPDALDISIDSKFMIAPSQGISSLYNGSEYGRAHDRQAYNLSVNMGYAGFRVGASFSRERMLNTPGLKGYDFGLGYNSDKWGANIRFAKYKRERDLLFTPAREFYNNISALEIGAAYQIFSNIRFTGRFTYYSYGHRNTHNKLKSSKVFFLGTNVNF